MKLKKIITVTLSAAMLSMLTVTAFADNNNEVMTSYTMEQVDKMNEKYAKFMSFTGKVKEISDYTNIEGAKIIMVESEDGLPANIIIKKDTYVVNNSELAVDSVVTVYYDASKPMILIYPPQYSAEVVVIGNNGNDDFNIKVDVFNEDLTSIDNFLKLNISDGTEIISEDGGKFEGELSNRKLVVLYGISTKSIPAQTTPSKIIVLDEDDPLITKEDVLTMDILVNDVKIETLKPFENDKGVIMVPVRSISEALGYDVGWDNEFKRVTIGNGISFEIGKDYYIYMKAAPIMLGTEPALINGNTYVPLNFFKDVVRITDAQVMDSQIIIKK